MVCFYCSWGCSFFVLSLICELFDYALCLRTCTATRRFCLPCRLESESSGNFKEILCHQSFCCSQYWLSWLSKIQSNKYGSDWSWYWCVGINYYLIDVVIFLHYKCRHLFVFPYVAFRNTYHSDSFCILIQILAVHFLVFSRMILEGFKLFGEAFRRRFVELFFFLFGRVHVQAASVNSLITILYFEPPAQI